MNRNESNLYDVYNKYKNVIFLNELEIESEGNYLLEHKNDLKPIVCIIIGSAGAGKTTWMQKHADKFLWQQFKQLDVDHTLQKYQLETCDEVAMKLLSGLTIFGVTEYNYRKNFDKLKKEITDELVSKTNKIGKFRMYVDLSEIHLDSKIGNSTLWEWAKRQDKITKTELFKKFDEEYKSCFRKKYLKSIFSMDMSKRDLAVKEYESLVQKKLSIEYNNNSVCIAITGNDIRTIRKLVKSVEHSDSVISVVYIDTTPEKSLYQNRKRNRKVSDEFVKNSSQKVPKTWEKLKKEYEKIGIWKLFHLKPIYANDELETSPRGYETVEIFTNETMLYNN